MNLEPNNKNKIKLPYINRISPRREPSQKRLPDRLPVFSYSPPPKKKIAIIDENLNVVILLQIIIIFSIWLTKCKDL